MLVTRVGLTCLTGPHCRQTIEISLHVLCRHTRFRRTSRRFQAQTRPRFLCTFFADTPDSDEIHGVSKLRPARDFFARSLQTHPIPTDFTELPSSDPPAISLHVLCRHTRFRRNSRSFQAQTRPRFLCTFFADTPDSDGLHGVAKFRPARDFFARSLQTHPIPTKFTKLPSSDPPAISLHVL